MGFLIKLYMPIKRKIIPYNPELKALAKQLRSNMTLSEVLLWNELKQKQVSGCDFDRQRPIGNYIVDFYCKDLSLAIEIDGDTHIYRYDYDDERQRNLEKLGVKFLRFEDIEVRKNMNDVIRVIEDWITKNQPKEPTPNPSKEGNLMEKDLNLYNKHNHDSHREKNIEENDLSRHKKTTPYPSEEGSFTESNPGQKKMFTFGPHEDGNLTN